MDELKIEILADGTIKVESDKVSAANHVTAEGFLKHLAELAGGPTTRTRKGHTHTHHHDHDHETEGYKH